MKWLLVVLVFFSAQTWSEFEGLDYNARMYKWLIENSQSFRVMREGNVDDYALFHVAVDFWHSFENREVRYNIQAIMLTFLLEKPHLVVARFNSDGPEHEAAWREFFKYSFMDFNETEEGLAEVKKLKSRVLAILEGINRDISENSQAYSGIPGMKESVQSLYLIANETPAEMRITY